MARTFLSDVLIHLYQGLLSISPNVDVNPTAEKADVVDLKMKCMLGNCKISD